MRCDECGFKITTTESHLTCSECGLQHDRLYTVTMHALNYNNVDLTYWSRKSSRMERIHSESDLREFKKVKKLKALRQRLEEIGCKN